MGKSNYKRTKFPRFDRYACKGDTISWKEGHLTIVATIHRDDDSGAPDKECEGFWPSLDPKDNGWIGPKSKSTLQRRMAHAKLVMEAWKNNDWFWCGISVRVYTHGGEPLNDEFDHALWSIECNYPQRGPKQHPNLHLGEVARELAGQALGDIKGNPETRDKVFWSSLGAL